MSDVKKPSYEVDEAEDGDEEFNESITGAAGGAIAGWLLGSNL